MSDRARAKIEKPRRLCRWRISWGYIGGINRRFTPGMIRSWVGPVQPTVAHGDQVVSQTRLAQSGNTRRPGPRVPLSVARVPASPFFRTAGPLLDQSTYDNSRPTRACHCSYLIRCPMLARLVRNGRRHGNRPRVSFLNSPGVDALANSFGKSHGKGVEKP